MKKQGAHHTVSANVFADHAELLHDLYQQMIIGRSELHGLKRVLIAGNCKGRVLQYLADQGVTAGSIFPDVVGLGRYLRWQFESLRTMFF
jgi:hypothetical protein